MALVDALGNLIRFVLLPGQRHDSIGVEPLIADLDFNALIGDKAFDHNWLRTNLNDRGAAAVIRPRPIALAGSLTTPKCTNGATWSRTSSALSRHSDASPPATKRPMPALLGSSTSSLRSSRSADCKQALALQLQFFLEMGFARSCLMSPAPKRPCEDAGVRDTSLV
ncbi:transposase [Bradyrhizobium sp. JR3.5]